MHVYPLKFKTIFKDKIWGGTKVRDILGKDFSPLPNCGETWELSGVQGNISEVSNGSLAGRRLNDLLQAEPEKILGKRIHKQFGAEFPLLIKFLDAREDLSIQVHPNDGLAKARHNSFGKSEMWYVLQADPGSTLISGFNRELDKKTYMEFFNSGRLNEILNVEQVKEGDVYYLPAGRVHTIGKGLMIAEIQQTSDVTYRIYDFDRLDDKGQKRELHVEQALDAIDYTKYDHYKTPYKDQVDALVTLVKSPFFTTNKLTLTRNYEVNKKGLDCSKIYICLSGSVTIGETPLQKGEVTLVPAAMETYTLETSKGAVLLESYID